MVQAGQPACTCRLLAICTAAYVEGRTERPSICADSFCTMASICFFISSLSFCLLTLFSACGAGPRSVILFRKLEAYQHHELTKTTNS